MRAGAADAANIKDSRAPKRRPKVAPLSEEAKRRAMDRLDLLKALSFGSQVAEEEIQFLESYFVQTDQWNRIVGGKIDIVRGEKGAGKSALYLLLGKNTNALFDRKILTVSGENPRGATVFKDLISDPPTSEPEFVVLWKVYILSIICHELRDLGIADGEIIARCFSSKPATVFGRSIVISDTYRIGRREVRRFLGVFAT